MSYQKPLQLMGDFETTVYEGQVKTEVWASAVVEIGTEDVKVFHSIEDTWEYLVSLKRSLIIYYHNLKFDGTFWLSYFLKHPKMYQALIEYPDGSVSWKENKDMLVNEYKYSVSDQGTWYDIRVQMHNFSIEIRDSLKLLPFSVKRIGESFKTKHRKLDIEYKGERYAGCYISPEEEEYIKNDVLVVSEALQILFDQGHDNLTIGACCMNEFRKTQDSKEYKLFFPNLYAIEIDENLYGSPTVGDYILKSYRGGWCYLVKGKENKLYHNGTTADVNSLYPSMMHSMSGNRYPIMTPKFWSGNYIPEEAKHESKYYFIRVRTRFRIKEGMLPFIQIRKSLMYRATEALETSDYYDRKRGKHYRYYKDKDGNKHDTYVTLTFTMTDWEMVQKHYDLLDCEILDGCYFWANTGLFDMYINKYKKIKQESSGAVRELAKLFLNNLYGKLAATTNSSFRVFELTEDNILYSVIQNERLKNPGYIACGSAITSYARRFTITAAQANFYGKDKRGFIYADTDSIHCDLDPSEVVDAPQHDTEFCHWKYEAQWDTGWFVRQKTYIEHVVGENCKPIDKPYYNIKCAGMPDRSKQLFLDSMNGNWKEMAEEREYNDEELEFVKVKRKLTDFTTGLRVPSKLMPEQIDGGTVLVETTYELR